MLISRPRSQSLGGQYLGSGIKQAVIKDVKRPSFVSADGARASRFSAGDCLGLAVC